MIVDKEIKETVGCDSLENKKSIEDKIEISDNIVMRKLLVSRSNMLEVHVI